MDLNTTERLRVPLCDIMLCVDQSFSENNSPFKIGRSLRSKSKIKHKNEAKIKIPKRILRKKRKYEDESESDKYESESDKDESYSFEESQEESESEEDSGKYKENKVRKKNMKISEFEKMVQKNREEKLAFLQSLKIDEIKEEIVESVKTITHRPKLPKPRIYNRTPKVKEPIRKSRRLAKLDINLSEDDVYQRVIAKALEYGNTNQPIKNLPSKYVFEEAISMKDDLSEFDNNFDFSVENDEEFDSMNYMSCFKNMQIGASNVAKLVPTKISSLTLHPSTDNIIVIAGSNKGYLGFWNMTSKSSPILFLPHQEGITNLKVNPYNSYHIISSSHDGTVRCGDMEKKSFDEIYNVSTETSCTYFDFVSATTYLVSLNNGNVSVIDVRNKSGKKHECHPHPVKTVHINPVNKNLFLTADKKGNMKLWDLRKLQKKSLIDVCHHKRGILSAFFSPVTGKHILTTSWDDTLCIFDSSNLETEILYEKTIRHNNHTGRWLTAFKATWLPNSDELFTVGSLDYPRKIEIYNTNGNNVFNFTNQEYLSTVASVNAFHPSMNVLAGGNSSGKVFIFADTQLKFNC